VTARPARIRTTDAEIDASLAAARSRKNRATHIVAASFDRKRDAIKATLSNGAEISVPRKSIAGLATVDPAGLLDLASQASGFSVWSERADCGVRLETLLEAVAGSSLVTIAARIVGATPSAAKVAAARENGRKGGRPRKTAARSASPRGKKTTTA
jgi:hypothetical protein